MSMSLKKFLTGKPGNIKELVEVAKNRNCPINVLYEGDWAVIEADGSISKARAIYSVGGIEELFARSDLRVIHRLDFSKSGIMIGSHAVDLSDGALDTLKLQEQRTIDHIQGEGIVCKIYELNKARNEERLLNEEMVRMSVKKLEKSKAAYTK